MTPQLETVLEISAIGTALLFSALAGLIGLMYLLTAQWLFRPAPVAATLINVRRLIDALIMTSDRLSSFGFHYPNFYVFKPYVVTMIP